MNEQEPVINVNIGANRYELRRDNSELYTYFGHYALFNHVFIEQQTDENVRTGLFLPEQYIGEDTFAILARSMIMQEYPARINQLKPTDSDMEIITRILAGDVDDTIPDTWL